MKICYVADGRSVIAKRFMHYFVEQGHDVHLISTFPCDRTDPPVSSLHVVPLDFSARARSVDIGGNGGLTTHGNPLISSLRGSGVWKRLAALRDQVNPIAVLYQRSKVRSIIEQIKPDIVHAMRIPFEGILAAYALEGTSSPLLISCWGNDFTLFASESPTVTKMTIRALRRADGFHPDCHRDLRLAREYGFDSGKPSVVLPGNGGVRLDMFSPGPVDPSFRRRFSIPDNVPVVVNPRGVKPYIRTDEFFQAIPLVLRERPDAFFVGAMMEGNVVAEKWCQRLNIGKSMLCLPFIKYHEMVQLFRLSTVTVSPADHDGTPNTLLEAMSCGTFPVAGDIESVREWIVDGENGVLFDQKDPQAMADAILKGLEDGALREKAFGLNQELVTSRAAYGPAMLRAYQLYCDTAARVRDVSFAAAS